MSKQLSDHALAAKNIRLELKAAFPGVKFSIRSESFSMGDSVDISWTNGPTRKEVEAITSKYQRGHFNGMEDIYEYDRDMDRSNGSSKYVMAQRSYSDETMEATIKSLCELTGTEYRENDHNLMIWNEWASTQAYRVLQANDIPAGTEVIALATIEGGCGLIHEVFTPVFA